MGNTDSKFVRPGDPRVPCFAIPGRLSSELKLVNLEGRSSSSVKISDHRCLGVVTIDGVVFAVTEKEILKLYSDGTTEPLVPPSLLIDFSQVVSFQKKIYIIRWGGASMLSFDPADSSLTDDLPRCGFGWGFCASATDDLIYAMGGFETATRAMKYDPLKRTWEETAPMRKGREWAAAATLNGNIYVVGGWYHRASVEYYNPGNNSWTEISNMNVGRKDFSACVVGDRLLYAVGGDGEKKNGFLQHSIEVYDMNKWTVVTKFQTKDLGIYSCSWPHGSHQHGGVLAEVKAPVGQLVAGNANVTELGDANNYVADLQENTDRSVPAGKAIYGQSTSSNVGENITVNRSGKQAEISMNPTIELIATGTAYSNS